MTELLRDLGEFIITPLFRWILLFLSIIISVIQYYNEPQRYSYAKSFEGLSYKWHLYIITVFICVTSVLTIIGFWASIPFTDALPDYWYFALLIILLAIVTLLTSIFRSLSMLKVSPLPISVVLVALEPMMLTLARVSDAMSLMDVIFAAVLSNITLSPFSGTPPLSQTDQLSPLAHESLTDPFQVHVSTAAMAVGTGISSNELKLSNPARIKFINLFMITICTPHKLISIA